MLLLVVSDSFHLRERGVVLAPKICDEYFAGVKRQLELLVELRSPSRPTRRVRARIEHNSIRTATERRTEWVLVLAESEARNVPPGTEVWDVQDE